MKAAEARALLPSDIAARLAEQAMNGELTDLQLDDLARLFGRGRAVTPVEDRRALLGPEGLAAATADAAVAPPLSDETRRALAALLAIRHTSRRAGC